MAHRPNCLGAAAALAAALLGIPPCPAQSAPAGKRGAAANPVHAAQPLLPPATALRHLQAGHEAWLDYQRQGGKAPVAAERPAGAGRYVAAVVHCADADLELASLLNQRRQDLLSIAVPGPFVTPETAALLVRQVQEQRLSLIILLGHSDCRLAAPATKPAAPDALAARQAHIAKEAERRRLSHGRALLAVQREQLLAASEELRQQVTSDRLWVVTAERDAESGAIHWLLPASAALPMPPVR